MKGLAIDTALGRCSVAMFEDDRILAACSEAMARGHQERLGGLVRGVAAEGGGFAGLTRIGVTVGPGSFTGLRVGLAFAQGLGTALGVPVVGLSTLDALAASVDHDGDVAALIDARRGQVYARFMQGGRWRGEPEALSVEAAATRAASLGAGVWLVGSGAPLVAALGGEAGMDPHILPLDGPTPFALARLTQEAETGPAPRPLYLRPPDATPPTRLPGQPREART